MPRGIPMRSSLRSRDSSSTSTGVDPRERVKDCCRKLVAFMCTQVGVGGLVVGYAIVGAFGFIMIESQVDPTATVCVREYIRREYADELWFSTASNQSVNVFNQTAFYVVSNSILQRYQENITKGRQQKLNCNGLTPTDLWSFPSALMFCLSVFTMIGYGSLVPKTQWGKGATVIYAVLGIPLYVLYFLNMGKVLAQTFKWLYTRLHECTGQRKPGQRIIVPSTACLWVICGYIVVGSIMFAEWEKWDYLDSTYFCVTSLCKIGMGDLVPGWSQRDSTEDSQTKLIINFVYLLLGMGLIAMCYNLMREDVYVKARELKEQLNQAMDAAHYKLMTCCNCKSEPAD
ncbi:PREDICTED: TWiK family of potassium channels protein 18 [Vollenhovia emeryi]|uniref:TWiK family of potassium channels protein 18 n=1 Tax=Vollenhovia emeryi TaxID=411798 RepID=UPI0005F4F6E3|nr:PREDICTED: TWiK family of potassium channels protein 18 [Vollenhovia emeryi]